MCFNSHAPEIRRPWTTTSDECRSISTRDFELTEWQPQLLRGRKASRRLIREHLRSYRGGKSLVGLACAELAARVRPDLQLAIVVPTEALAQQWIEVVDRYTSVGRSEIGLLGAGGKDDWHRSGAHHRAEHCGQRLPELAAGCPH